MNTPAYKNIHSAGQRGALKAVLGIVAALALIGGAVYVQAQGTNVPQLDIAPITSEDHLRGNIDAPVQVIEYSDLECPFCKDFHKTMLQIYAEYGQSGKIAWAYRHFPLEQLHALARPEAVATECIAKYGGNDAFWKATDEIFARTKSNDGLPATDLPGIAKAAGVAAKDMAAYTKCVADAETDGEVAEDIETGVAAGAQGTPYTVVISPAGNTYAISGAYPYAEVKATIEKALAEKAD